MEWLTQLLGGLGGSGFTPTAPTGGAPLGPQHMGSDMNPFPTPIPSAPNSAMNPQMLQMMKGLMGGMFQQPSQPGIIPTPALMPTPQVQPSAQSTLLGSISAPPYNPLSPRLRRA